MAPPISTGIEKIDHELTQGQQGAARALRMWMMECARVPASCFSRNTPTVMRLNQALDRILATGLDPDTLQSARRPTAICICAMKNNVPGMRALSIAGASVGLVVGATPLGTALAHGHDQAAAFALEIGADPTQPNDWGVSPVQIALQTMNLDMVERLIALGATLNPRSALDPHPVSEAIEAWSDAAVPPTARANLLNLLVEIPGLNLDVDAACHGRPASRAIEESIGPGSAAMLARARQGRLDMGVSRSANPAPATHLKRM